MPNALPVSTISVWWSTTWLRLRPCGNHAARTCVRSTRAAAPRQYYPTSMIRMAFEWNCFSYHRTRFTPRRRTAGNSFGKRTADLDAALAPRHLRQVGCEAPVTPLPEMARVLNTDRRSGTTTRPRPYIHHAAVA